MVVTPADFRCIGIGRLCGEEPDLPVGVPSQWASD